MKIGVPKEIKNNEFRVGLTPESVAEVVAHGHEVLLQSQAGLGIGATDQQYVAAGAAIVESADVIYGESELVVKVKEPQAAERQMLREGQVLYAYLHLAPDRQQADDLLRAGVVGIAYETVTDAQGGLPMLKPMSQVAGRLSIQAGAWALEESHGGRGVLLGGVPGVEPGRVVIIGGGVVGFNAAQMAVGLQADVTVLDTNPSTLERLNQYFGNRARVLHSNPAVLQHWVEQADLVIGAVLVPGASAPRVIRREQLPQLRKGAVLVDVAIDQGGCFETSHPTTHAEPLFQVDGVVHYCVANMPGAVPHTSTYALNNATLPGLLALADKGWRQALQEDEHLLQGLNVCYGKTTHTAVAAALGYDFTAVDSLPFIDS